MVMASRRVHRRTFLIDLGHGACALAVFGIAACSPSASPSASRSSPAPPPSPASSGPESPESGVPSPSSAPTAVAWERVELAIVSAYILARNGEAAIVDTGVAGSEDEIEASLAMIGLEWGAVGHVILTHLHPDHVGSATDVLGSAPDAKGYAGAPDISSIRVPRPLTEVADGDEVFGLRIVATPGHTPGHISVLDPVGGIFVAGDALNTVDGKVTGANPEFSQDMTTADASVKAIAALEFETLLVGHGDPITKGASKLVAELAAGL